MQLTEILFLLIFWLTTLVITYRYGLLTGREHADRILGIERKKALRRIQNQANRNQ